MVRESRDCILDTQEGLLFGDRSPILGSIITHESRDRYVCKSDLRHSYITCGDIMATHRLLVAEANRYGITIGHRIIGAISYRREYGILGILPNGAIQKILSPNRSPRAEGYNRSISEGPSGKTRPLGIQNIIIRF
jgi:hypothetical protein